ncbi:unnamed protein product [Didymodactylos carnosus]|uniref:Calponin-homology (CH) domain-containing protein n=1 Tax=Didymodactylos carnosus TaxID=1234261 RepID=A0A814EMR1_9BILA|nr:unnamed protein product [Didymodactylos carnosus]CAF1012009.1 unnamed protein product [Didymodactylos carnosus]CAF3744624.1 unnamed protein product [Didymodactylos carnosus]CAF3780903.1 unnamed protein product [Didymodactylos carnosus]
MSNTSKDDMSVSTSILEKLPLTSTLQRHRKKSLKKRQEIEKLLQEGISSINLASPSTTANTTNVLHSVDSDYYQLNEGEERSMLEPSTYNDKDFQETVKFLLQWINHVLVSERMIVKSIENDLFDGYVFKKLIETFEQIHLSNGDDNIPLSEQRQRETIKTVLKYFNSHINNYDKIKWSVEKLYRKDIVSMLHFLLALIEYYDHQQMNSLPKTLLVKVIVVKKCNGLLQTRIVHDQLIDNHEISNDIKQHDDEENDFVQDERHGHVVDAIDALFDLASSEKLFIVEKTLLKFVNKYLNPLNIHIKQLDVKQFQDGLNLLYLISSLENYFLVLKSYHHSKPLTYDQSLFNLNFAFDLINEAGINVRKYCRINDILMKTDKKTIYRLLYQLFLKYNQHQQPQAQANILPKENIISTNYHTNDLHSYYYDGDSPLL